MQGNPALLGTARQRLLAEYIFYKSLVLDWADEEPLTKADVGAAFMADRTMPKGLMTFIANCFEGEWQAAFRSHFIGLAPKDQFTGPDMPKNTKKLCRRVRQSFCFRHSPPTRRFYGLSGACAR